MEKNKLTVALLLFSCLGLSGHAVAQKYGSDTNESKRQFNERQSSERQSTDMFYPSMPQRADLKDRDVTIIQPTPPINMFSGVILPDMPGVCSLSSSETQLADLNKDGYLDPSEIDNFCRQRDRQRDINNNPKFLPVQRSPLSTDIYPPNDLRSLRSPDVPPARPVEKVYLPVNKALPLPVDSRPLKSKIK